MSYVVDYIPGMSWGLGFNSATLDIHPVTAFTEIASITTPGGARGQETFFSIQVASNTLGFSEQLKASASASLKYGVTGSGSAKAKYVNKISQNNYVIYIIVSVSVTNYFSVMDMSTSALSAAAGELYANHPDEFLQQYGDTFVYGVSTGGEFIGILEIESSSSSEFNSIKAAVNGKASYGIFKGEAKAEFSKCLQEITSSYSLNGSIFRRGDSGPLNNMTPEEFTQAAVTFPEDVAGDNGYPYSAIIVPYSHIPHPRSTPISTAGQAAALAGLESVRNRLTLYANDLLYAVERIDQFPGANPANIQQRYNEVNGEIAKVLDAARLCYADSSSCQVPDLKLSLLEPILPSRKDNIDDPSDTHFKVLYSLEHGPNPNPFCKIRWRVKAAPEVLNRAKACIYTVVSWSETNIPDSTLHRPHLNLSTFIIQERTSDFELVFETNVCVLRSLEARLLFENGLSSAELWFSPNPGYPPLEVKDHEGDKCPFKNFTLEGWE